MTAKADAGTLKSVKKSDTTHAMTRRCATNA
jgi:hypothetical protein